MLNNMIFIQVLGFCAFIISTGSYQFKNQKKLFATRLVSDSIWAVHFFLLGGPIASFSIVVAALRTFLAVFIFPKYRGIIVVTAALIIIGFAILTYDGQIINYMIGLGAIIYGISTYHHKSYKISRTCMFIGTLLWMMIGIILGSIPEIVSGLVNLTSISIGFYRHRQKRRELKSEP